MEIPFSLVYNEKIFSLLSCWRIKEMGFLDERKFFQLQWNNCLLKFFHAFHDAFHYVKFYRWKIKFWKLNLSCWNTCLLSFYEIIFEFLLNKRKVLFSCFCTRISCKRQSISYFRSSRYELSFCVSKSHRRKKISDFFMRILPFAHFFFTGA
jgi:hypothetical protein